MKLALQDQRGLDSLPVAADWQDWWKVWGPKIAKEHGKAGWVLFLLEANERILNLTMTLSRILRNKPEWNSVGWSQQEWLNCEDVAGQALAWFEQHAESPMRDAPEWCKFLFVAQHGNLAVLARLGRELRAAQEQGYTVAVLERGADGISLMEAD